MKFSLAFDSAPRALALGLVLAATSVAAQPADEPAATGESSDVSGERRIDETAEKLMRGACEYLAGKQAFSVHGESTFDEVFRSGRHVQHSRSVSFVLNRPDRMRAEFTGDKGRRDFYYDGKTVTISDIDAKVYGRFHAPPTIEAMLDDAVERFGVTMPMADLASANPCAALETKVERVWYLGQHYLAGAPHHHLLLSAPEVDLQVWLPVSGPPLFRKLTLAYKNDPGYPKYEVMLSDWNFTPQTDAAHFTFTPPTGVQQIEFVRIAETTPGKTPEKPQ